MGKLVDPAGIGGLASGGGGLNYTDPEAVQYVQAHQSDADAAAAAYKPKSDSDFFDPYSWGRQQVNAAASAAAAQQASQAAATQQATDSANASIADSNQKIEAAKTSSNYSQQATQNVKNNQINAMQVSQSISDTASTPQKAPDVQVHADDDEGSRKRPGGYTQRATGIRLS